MKSDPATMLPPALLSYAITPTSTLVESAAVFQIVATNGTGQGLCCSRIEFVVPCGTSRASLAAEPASISAEAVMGTNWSISADGTGRFTATPNVHQEELTPGSSIAFLLSAVLVGRVPGLAVVQVIESSGAPTVIDRQASSLSVAKIPSGLAISSFTGAPVSTVPGGVVSLAWTTIGATSCTLSWDGMSAPVQPNGGMPVRPDVTTTYTLTAQGGGRVTTQQISITVSAPREVRLFDLNEAIAVLQRTPAVFRALLGGLPESWTSCNEGPDTFSPFDNLGHLIHGERADWIPRARIILAQGPERRFEPYDRFAQVRESAGRSVHDLLDEFTALRASSIATLQSWNLSEQDFGLEGEHSEFGAVTLRQLLATWVAHDLGHIAQTTRVMAKHYREHVGPWRAYLPVLDR